MLHTEIISETAIDELLGVSEEYGDDDDDDLTKQTAAELRKFFGAFGVTFPDGSYVHLAPDLQRLVVRNTQENIAKIKRIISEHGEARQFRVSVQVYHLPFTEYEAVPTIGEFTSEKLNDFLVCAQSEIVLSGNESVFRSEGIPAAGEKAEITLCGMFKVAVTSNRFLADVEIGYLAKADAEKAELNQEATMPVFELTFPGLLGYDIKASERLVVLEDRRYWEVFILKAEESN